MGEACISTPKQQAAFIAQCGYESAQFTRVREYMSYSVRALMATWPHKFPTVESATPYAFSPQALAIHVYGGQLGNLPEPSSDGWDYRGGAWLQITGKAQYKQIGDLIKVDLLGFPIKIEDQLTCARASAAWWRSHGCNEIAETGDIDKVTETINGHAMLGRAERAELYDKLLPIIEAQGAPVLT